MERLNGLKSTRGKVHDFLGMNLDFSKPGKLKVDMKKCVEEMIEYFSVDLNNDKSKTPGGDWLFATRKAAKNETKK